MGRDLVDNVDCCTGEEDRVEGRKHSLRCLTTTLYKLKLKDTNEKLKEAVECLRTLEALNRALSREVENLQTDKLLDRVEAEPSIGNSMSKND